MTDPSPSRPPFSNHIANIPVFPDRDPSDALPWNPDQSIPQRFAQVLALHPYHPAIAANEGWTPGFSDLDHWTDDLALHLLSRNIRKGQRIAIFMEHNALQMASALAVFKSGAVVVVLNDGEPDSRISSIIRDAEPSLVLCERKTRDTASRIFPTDAILQCDDHFQIGSTGGRAKPPIHPPHAHDLAAILYTSGTSGPPKGVMQTHCNILHNAARQSLAINITPQDRILMTASLGGGQGIATWAMAWMNGATLAPFPVSSRGLNGLVELISTQQLSVLVASTSLYRSFLKILPAKQSFHSVRIVRLASEKATREDWLRFKEHFSTNCKLFHTYSSTETGNISYSILGHEDDPAEGVLSVGKCAKDIHLAILDPVGLPMPFGGAGDIAVFSSHNTPGYWRSPGLTRQRMLPAGPDGQKPAFITGDRGILSATGDLSLLGRADDQVKIRGNRIHTSDIEQAILNTGEVSETVVITIPQDPHPILVAFMVPQSGTFPNRDIQALRSRMREQLPIHMVPNQLHWIERIPLNSNGKPDKQALCAMAADPLPNLEATDAKRLGSPTEKELIELWRSGFPGAEISRTSDFFELGGDSLQAAVLSARIHAKWAVEIDMKTFFENPMLCQLAGIIDGQFQRLPADHHTDLPQPQSRDKELPLSLVEEYLFELCDSDHQASLGWNVACVHRIRGTLDQPSFCKAIETLINRHEILRTTYHCINGSTHRVIHPPIPFAIPSQDLSTHPNPENAALEILKKQFLVPFDLSRLSLLKFTLIKVGEQEHFLLRINHHIISDGWSWLVFFRELAILYEAAIKGQQPVLPSNHLQYADFALWQRNRLLPESPRIAPILDWWTHRFQDGVRISELPFPKVRFGRKASPIDGKLTWGIDPRTSAALDQLARNRGFTFFGIRMAIFSILIGEGVSRESLVIGSYAANRTLIDTQNMFGFISNPVIHRFQFDPDLTGIEWIRHVQHNIAETQTMSEIPIRHLRSLLLNRGIHIPKPSVILSVVDNTQAIPMGPVELSWHDRHSEVMPWGFAFQINRHNEATHCYARFNAHQFHPDDVLALIHRYRRLLELAAFNPNMSVKEWIAHAGPKPWESSTSRLRSFYENSAAHLREFPRRFMAKSKSILSNNR